VSSATHGQRLFRIRGIVFAALALLALAAAGPRSQLMAPGWLLLGIGCALRCWAFAHLGSQGRTRDPAPPSRRVTSGPYRWFPHPIYLGNVVIALGLLLCAAPPFGVAAALLVTVAVSYFVLGRREGQQLDSVRGLHGGVRMTLAGVARSERSTWLQLALFQVCVMLRADLVG